MTKKFVLIVPGNYDRLLHVVTLLIFAFAGTVVLSGCVRSAEYPPGTVRPVTAVVDLQTVSVSSREKGAEQLQDTYLLGPGDILAVNVSGKPELSTYPLNRGEQGVKGSRVDGSGNVHLPLVGSVRVAGQTIEQAHAVVLDAYKKYLKDPWVVIEIVEFKARQVFVFGAVRKPGPVPMSEGSLNLAQAIASADVRDAVHDFTHVRIIRSLSATSGELIVLDFEKILRGEALPFPLANGDIVFVPKNGFGTWNDVMNEIIPSLQAVAFTLQPFVQLKYLNK